MTKLIFGIVGMFALQSVAHAQNESWDWSGGPYLWTAGVEGDTVLGTTTQEIDLSFSDMTDFLQSAFALHLEGHKGDNAVFGDLMIMRLEPEEAREVSVEFDIGLVEAGYLRKFPNPRGFAGLELGVRWWGFDLTVAPPPIIVVPSVTIPDKIIDGREQWWDGFIGYRIRRDLGPNWSFVGRGNLGAGGADSSWALQGQFIREFDNGNRLSLGVRTLAVDYRDFVAGGTRFVTDLTFGGFEVGYMFD